MSDQLEVLGGSRILKDLFKLALKRAPRPNYDGSRISIVIDEPTGTAAEALPDLCGLTVVVASNTCPEYLDGIWNLGPNALVPYEGSYELLLTVLDMIHED